jgi:hypothetical protein
VFVPRMLSTKCVHALRAVTALAASVTITWMVTIAAVGAEPTPTSGAAAPLGIKGSMHIDFGSRIQPEGTDTYDVDLVCADALRIKGKIVRQPRELSSFFGREKKPQELHYHLVFSVINPANRSDEKRAGLMSGVVKVRSDGTYDLSGLKIAGTLPPFAYPLSGDFGGAIKGKAADKSGLLSVAYSRIFGGKKVTVVLSKVDPLSFDRVQLAGGPLNFYPQTSVSGSLDFDYETGNWLSTGITFSSGPGTGKKDVVAGTIKWIAGDDREQTGVSRYEFNLRYNEAALAAPVDESAAFSGAENEEAFFVVDDKIPTLKGTVTYKDEFGVKESEDEEAPVVSSDISYALEGNKLTKEQLITFVKWWLLLVGPVNDE